MEKASIELSIILACYNEESYLEYSVQQICDVLYSTDIAFELIFVDDGSTDRTREIIDTLVERSPGLMRKIFNKKNIGRGGAVTRGIRRAKGQYVGFVDLDLEVGAHYIPHCVRSLRSGASVVTAWRIYTFKLDGIFRWITSKGYTALVKLVLKLPFHDTETGFKFFKRQHILSILDEMKDNGWFWDTEIMARCFQKKLKVHENPCLFLRRSDKKSSVNIIHDSFIYFIKLLKYRRELSVR